MNEYEFKLTEEQVYKIYRTLYDIIGEKYYNELSKKKTYTQINTLNTIFKAFLNWCCKHSYLIKNPCLNLDLKGNKSDIINHQRKEVEILNTKEINIIKKYIKDTDFELIFLLDLGTGLRLGELLALDWEHIDLSKKEITIEKSVKEVYIYDSPEKKHIETYSISDYKDGLRNGLVSTDISEKGHVNIFFKYTNSLSKYTQLKEEEYKENEFGENNVMDNAYIEITKIEYYSKN